MAGTDKTFNFKIASWHGFADSSGNILSDLSKDNVLQNGQLTTCTNTSHTCRLQVNSLETGQKTQCQHTWSKADIESKTELWAHTYGEVQTTTSTCVTQGEKYQECTCGDKKHLETLAVDPANHESLDVSKLVWVAGQKVPGTETELTEAMHCGYAGKYGHLCSACNKYANEVEKAAGIGANDEPIEHVADTSNAQVGSAPTCCEYGTGYYNCHNCGLKARDLTEEEIKQESKLQPTNNHVWKSEYFIEKKPTCTENAVAYYQCSNEKCKATTTDGIDFETDINVKALGHDMHFEITTEATCYSTGYQIEKCHRDGCNATGKEEQIPVKEHEIDKEHKHNDIALTCKDDGSYEYRCKWYDGVNCTEKEVITAATDDSLVATGKHTRPSEGDPGYLEITNHPTCTENGVGHYVCTVCQTYVQLDPANEPKLQAKGHTWTDVVEETYIKTPADCTNAAVYYKSCSVCKEKHASETFVHGNPIGHTWENIVEEQYIKTHANCTNAAVY